MSATSQRPRSLRMRRAKMEAIVEHCCGLDVHQATIVACLFVGEANRKPRKEVRTFGTMTAELQRLRDWLQSEGCTHVAMEYGVCWMPAYAILEGHSELVVGNATHIKQVPGPQHRRECDYAQHRLKSLQRQAETLGYRPTLTQPEAHVYLAAAKKAKFAKDAGVARLVRQW